MITTSMHSSGRGNGFTTSWQMILSSGIFIIILYPIEKYKVFGLSV